MFDGVGIVPVPTNFESVHLNRLIFYCFWVILTAFFSEVMERNRITEPKTESLESRGTDNN